MSLNESIVEDAALEWFGELGYAVGHGPHLGPGEHAGGTLTPALSQKESGKDEGIRRLNVSIPEEARATVKESLSVPKHIERKLNP